MDALTLRKWLLAVSMMTPWVAGAAGLGPLTVLSSLGQPLHAEIDLLSVQKEDLASLSVRLASPDAYQKAGLRYTGTVTGVALHIDKRPNGQPYIKIISTRPANEFVVSVLVDFSWASGRLMRGYDVPLDPPGVVPPAVAAQSSPFEQHAAQR